MKIFDSVNLWLRIGRSYTLPQSILPYVFAVILASKDYSVNILQSFLGLIGVILVHMSINMLDDYFDWKKGAVDEYKKLLKSNDKVKTQKCFYLDQNLTTPQKLLITALTMDLIACLIGLYIMLKVGIGILIIAGITGLIGFFYSAPPFRLSYRGLGEPLIGVIFGPLLIIGAYLTTGAALDNKVIWASIPIGALIANIAHTHAIMDFDADIKVGKTSLATAVGTKNNAIIIQSLIYLFAYSTTLIEIIQGSLPKTAILTLLTVPMAFALVKMMKSESKIRRLWMGFIENWQQIQKENTEWFMIRLCISRNIAVEYIVILAISYYLFG